MNNNIIPAPQAHVFGAPPNVKPDIDRVLAVPGATIGDEFEAAATGLKHAIEARTNGTDEALQAWSAAILTGDPQAIDEAAARYAVAHILKDQFDAYSRIQKDVAAAQRRAYLQAAPANYEAARAVYEAAVEALAQAVAVVDPTAEPRDLIAASPKIRNAWLEADALAEVAGEALGTLVLSARLANVLLAHPSHERGEDHGLSVLSLDREDGPTRRQAWQAWDEGHEQRGGPLAALLRIGADVSALALEDVRPYRRPKQMEERLVQSPGIGHHRVLIDPEEHVEA